MLRIDVLVVGLLLTLAGCSSGAPPTPTDASSAQSPTPPAPTVERGRVLDGDGYRTLVAGATYAFLAAMHGRVAVGDGGCLILRDETGPGAVAVWPPGTTILDDGRVGVHVPGVGAIVVGDRVEGSGGHFEAPRTEDEPPGHLPPMPAECGAAGAPISVLQDVTRHNDG
ncbi:hypothetical protein [Micromonospora sp. NPDC003241]